MLLKPPPLDVYQTKPNLPCTMYPTNNWTMCTLGTRPMPYAQIVQLFDLYDECSTFRPTGGDRAHLTGSRVEGKARRAKIVYDEGEGEAPFK